MKYLILPALLLAALSSYSQATRKAFFYCLDHNDKVLYYSTGNATVKKGLENKDFYQYGFMKRMGWINKSWQGLAYDMQIPSGSQVNLLEQRSDSLGKLYRSKGYVIKKVPMPYPMKPFTGYKKDGTN